MWKIMEYSICRDEELKNVGVEKEFGKICLRKRVLCFLFVVWWWVKYGTCSLRLCCGLGKLGVVWACFCSRPRCWVGLFITGFYLCQTIRLISTKRMSIMRGLTMEDCAQREGKVGISVMTSPLNLQTPLSLQNPLYPQVHTLDRW